MALVKNEYGALVNWYQQGETEVLGEKSIPAPFCPPEILHVHSTPLMMERETVRNRQQLSANLYNIYHCRVYSEKLLTMD